jgi:hypothetical protein
VVGPGGCEEDGVIGNVPEKSTAKTRGSVESVFFQALYDTILSR